MNVEILNKFNKLSFLGWVFHFHWKLGGVLAINSQNQGVHKL